MIDLYGNIKARRKELGLTQTELALKVGYSEKSSIARIEKGEVDLPLSKLNEFAKALDCTVDYLMGWSNIPENIIYSDEDLQTFQTAVDRLATLHSTHLRQINNLFEILENDTSFANFISFYYQLSKEDKERAYDYLEALNHKDWKTVEIIDLKRMIRSLEIEELKQIVGYAQAVLDMKSN